MCEQLVSVILSGLCLLTLFALGFFLVMEVHIAAGFAVAATAWCLWVVMTIFCIPPIIFRIRGRWFRLS